MIISLDDEPTPLHVKILGRSAIQGTYLTIIEAIYSNPIANIKLNGEKLKAVLLKSGMRKGCQLFSLLYP